MTEPTVEQRFDRLFWETRRGFALACLNLTGQPLWSTPEQLGEELGNALHETYDQ